jgi:heptosyltransferase III
MAGNNKILIFHPGALGDGLLALSAVRILKGTVFNDSEVVWFGHPSLGRVLRHCGEVDQAFSFEDVNLADPAKMRQLGIWRAISPMTSESRIVGWLSDEDGWWRTNLEDYGYSNILLKSPLDATLMSFHMEARYVETLKELVEPSNPTHEWGVHGFLHGSFPCPQIAQIVQAEIRKDNIIVLHPGSGSPKKCAPLGFLCHLIKSLRKRFSEKLCVIGGPADTEMFDALQLAFGEDNPLFVKNLDLFSVCGLLQRSRFYIGHDSGLSHLAAKIGVPSLLLFGPTDPAVWAPRGSHVRVFRNHKLEFSPGEILMAIEAMTSIRNAKSGYN